MKEIQLKLFILKRCPYCIRVNQYLEELLPLETYADIKIITIDESIERDLAKAHDYFLVPSFYYQDQKLFEGIMRKEDVQAVLDKALNLAQEKSL